MGGRQARAMACAVVLAACATAPKTPHWTPYLPQPMPVDFGKAIIAGFDVNHDKKVSRWELEAGLRQYFRQADTNRDGRLDPDEVAAANQRRIRLDKSNAIPLIDWNQDGYVDFDEFAAGLCSLFEQLDLNGDGEVTEDEFRRAP